MTTWGYLLLIAALLILAGVMVYARFLSRSTAKSLHHSPVDWGLSGAADCEVPAGVSEPGPAAETQVRLEPAPVLITARDEAEAPGRGYLDELQEAAAGLAMLMRSSPIVRADRVVFEEAVTLAEPDREAMAAGESSGIEEIAGIAEEPAEAAEAAFKADPDFSGGPGLIVPGLPEPGELEPAVPAPLSLRERIGDWVGEHFDHIDEGLGTLEELVGGIEDSLRALARTDFGEGDSGEGECGARVAEAA